MLPPATHQSPKCYHPCYPPVRGGAVRISRLRISANATTLLHTNRSKLAQTPPRSGGEHPNLSQNQRFAPPHSGGEQANFLEMLQKPEIRVLPPKPQKLPPKMVMLPPVREGVLVCSCYHPSHLGWGVEYTPKPVLPPDRGGLYTPIQFIGNIEHWVAPPAPPL